ncbi:MAG: hypothetical protein RLY86_1334 [Pseudomonadota bacterium]|jgi:hypothetical protein
MALTILQVAYPLAPVGPDSVGGAEQIVYHLDRGLTARGHSSLVLAARGSRPCGTHIPVPAAPAPYDDGAKAAAQATHRRAIVQALENHPVDLVHLHGIDALEYLPPPGVPVLITLHLPPDWYPPAIWATGRPDTWLVPVSDSQRRACPDSPALLPPVPNGVPVADLAWRGTKAGFTAALGRICPEKGFDQAVAAAKMADVPLLIAGRLYPYAAHQDYFRTVLAPALDRRRRFLGPLGPVGKRRLMGMARAVLIPSLCAETASLVAMEAAACGTPVIAFPHGALPEVVVQGKTGFLVPDAAAMADAIGQAGRIDGEECRAVAQARFSLDRMVDGYLDTYRRILNQATAQPAPALPTPALPTPALPGHG